MSTLLPFTADGLVARTLGADLEAADGYTVDALDALWGAEAAAALHRGNRVPALRALAQRNARDGVTPIATLATLFLLGQSVTATDARAAFPTSGVDALIDGGILAAGSSRDTVVAAVDVRPYAFVDDAGNGRWWIVSDLGELALGRALDEGHVLGIGGATTTLAGLMLPVHVGSVLDLGTGCGILALHARRFADRVVATDISARALAIAAFNASLNGIDGIEFRHGSLFDPVVGERFDRIVSNPPFVITPRRTDVPAYEYRDGGMVGDALVETVLAGLASHLAPGGTAQLLGNWEYRWGDDGLDRVEGWLRDTALDVWIVERERQDPSEYAETWIRDGGTRPGSPGYDQLVDAWLDDFAERHVTGVGFGYVVVRASPGGGPLFRRLERLHGVLGVSTGALGGAVARTFDAIDWLRATDDAALAAAHLRVGGDITEERHYWPGNEDPTVISLVQGGGFGRRVEAGTALAAFVGACDGELAVGAIIAALAQLLEADTVALIAEVVPQVRDLVRDGFLSPWL